MTINNNIPQFIVVEGIEGAGKSTIINYIKKLFDNNNINYIQTREPGGTKLAEDIRSIFKADYNNEKIYPETEVLLLYAARLQLVNNIIKPALNNNTWVLGDRHDLSTIAYQVGGRGVDINFINNIKAGVLSDFSFDLCIYLDINPEVGLARARNRGSLDRIEQEDIKFFDKIRAKYLELASKNDKIITIDSSRDLEQIEEDIYNLFKSKYYFK